MSFNLDGNISSRVDPYFDKERIVLDVFARRQEIVRHKLGKAKAELVGVTTRPLKVGPLRVRDEALDHVARLLPIRRLIQQGKTHSVLERPLEDGVVLAGQNLGRRHLMNRIPVAVDAVETR